LPLQVHCLADIYLYTFVWNKNPTFLFSKPLPTEKQTSPPPIHLFCCSYFFRSTTRFSLTTLCLAIPLPHNQPMSNNIHSSTLIPNKRKWRKNIQAIKTIASPLVLFFISIAVMCKHSQLKIGKTVFFQNPKTWVHTQTLKLKFCYIIWEQNINKLKVRLKLQWLAFYSI
jgi:hypothetical protein